MGSAYTPGLKVSARTTVEKLRRLPLKGRVLVERGQIVTPDTVVARTDIPGPLHTVKIADKLGISAGEAAELLTVKTGDVIRAGDLLAQSRGLFGRWFRNELHAPCAGTVEFFSPATGNLGLRAAPLPVERTAYVHGVVSEVIPEEGVIVRCEGAFIQGIFGVGGERTGEITLSASAPERILTEDDLNETHCGKIVIAGTGVSAGALRKAAEVGAVGIVAGGIVDRDLMDYLAEALNEPGFDIGVAITGQEPIPFTLILTEGFGEIRMAERTYQLLRALEGRAASINGATQIRAGVIRPEVIVPDLASAHEADLLSSDPVEGEGALAPGANIRIIREPWFGILAVVTDLPYEPVSIESGAVVRVLEARLADGTLVTVPRANVEIIAAN